MKQKNIMNIVPFYDGKGKSCYDNIIISVAVWAEIDYRPMYADQWKFSFEMKKNPTGIWKRGKMASYLYYDDQLLTGRNLNRFTKLTVYSKDEEALSIIRNHLLRNRPVGVIADTYYVPWLEKHYQEVHSEHAFLAVGCDEKGIYCNDVRDNKQAVIQERIENELFEEMYLNKCAIFEIDQDKEMDGDVLSEIKKVNYDSFDKMQDFANVIEKSGFNISEVEPFDAGEGILLRALRNIVRSRYNYISALEYVREYTGKDNISKIISLIQESNKNWELIKILIYKAFLENKINEYNAKIVSLIKQSRELEQNAYQILIDL